MVMNMWFFSILYFCEIVTDFVDKVIDRISEISFICSRDGPIGILKLQTHYDKTKCSGKLDSTMKDEEWITTVYDGSCSTGNNFRCYLATTPGETRDVKVSRWDKIYNNLRTFFRIFRINRNL